MLISSVHGLSSSVLGLKLSDQLWLKMLSPERRANIGWSTEQTTTLLSNRDVWVTALSLDCKLQKPWAAKPACMQQMVHHIDNRPWQTWSLAPYSITSVLLIHDCIACIRACASNVIYRFSLIITTIIICARGYCLWSHVSIEEWVL